MNKKLIGVSLAAALMLAAVVAVPAVRATNKGPATLTLDYNGKSKHVANFPHHEHQERLHDDCKACHHKYEGSGDPKPCKSCHGDKAEGDKPKIQDAYHKKCRDGCHKTEKKGPTKCADCHDRK